MTLLDDEKSCKELLNAHRAKIAQIAHAKVREGYALEDMVVFCAETSDPKWEKVINHVVDEHDCEELTIDGQTDPIVIGAIASGEALLIFHRILPSVTRILAARGKDGLLAVLIVHRDASGLFLEKLEPPRLIN